MINCEECGNKIGILQGYRHPALGKRFLVCQKCFKKIDEDMERWSTFCFSDTYTTKLSKIDVQEAWHKNLSNNPPLQLWFSNLWIKIGLKGA